MEMPLSEKTDTGVWRFAAWIALALVIVLADQASKWAIIEWIDVFGKVPINAFLNLTHQHNEGAAWSILSNAGGWQRWFFIVLAAGVSSVLAVWIWRIRNEGPALLAAALALVLGGALGNVIDRIRLGYVTDFIQVWFGSWAFPSFNVADAAITVGAALLIIDSIFLSGRKDSSVADKES